jgi:hypothetical protein
MLLEEIALTNTLEYISGAMDPFPRNDQETEIALIADAHLPPTLNWDFLQE